MNFLYILAINLLSDLFANIFSHLVGCPLVSWQFLLLGRNFLFDTVPFVYFCLYFCCLWGEIPKILSKTKVHKFSAYVFFYVLYCFISLFRSLFHFESIFAHGAKLQSSFLLLHVAFSFSQHHQLKRLSFHCCIILAPLSEIICPYTCGFISGLSILFHCSVCLFFCQYHIISIVVTLQYNLKSGNVIPLALILFLSVALVIWGCSWCHTNLMIFGPVL